MLLDMRDVHVTVNTKVGQRTLLQLSELHVAAGESVGIVGETGSGKTMASLAVTRLFPSSAIRLSGGSVQFQGREITRLPQADLARLRGRKIGMIFQDPSTSLNPVFSVGRMLTDLVRTHHKVGKVEGKKRSLELLRRVELPNPSELYHRYPFELSGGQRQRVMIAMALAGQPELLIADEPTTALDVTVQAGVLALIRRLQQESNLAMLVITHNLGLVAHMTNRVYVMYRGQVVESGLTTDVLLKPSHPYTQMLLRAVPRWQTRGTALTIGEQSASVITQVSSPVSEVPVEAEIATTAVTAAAAGCSFAERCPLAVASCRITNPVLQAIPDTDHHTACLRWEVLDHVRADA